MGMITNDWLDAIGEEFKKPYYQQLFEFVKEEYSRTVNTVFNKNTPCSVHFFR